MKKKILALCLVVVLAITAVTGATLAYFTDTEEQINTFTVGNVDIEIEEIFPDKELMPGSKTENNLQKEVYIKNIGDNEAYMWAEILIPSALDDGNTLNTPAPGIGNNLHFNYYDTYVENGKDVLVSGAYATANGLGDPKFVCNLVWMGEEEIEGVYYNRYVSYIENDTAKAKNQTTAALLAQVYMDSKVTQCTTEGHPANCLVLMDGTTHYDGSWELIVRGFGIQADGIDTIKEAINTYYDKTVIA